MLNPVFSTAHLRILKSLNQPLRPDSVEIDILHWISRAALEIIGQSALGYSFDPLVEGAKPHPFGAAKEFSPATDDLLFLREYLLQNLIKIGPPYFRRFIIDHCPWKTPRRIRDVIDTMDRDGHAAEKDLIAILMKANMNTNEEDRLPDKEVLAQMSTFAFAGTDTTSNVLAQILHLLSYRPEIQDKLRDEITTILGDHMESDKSYDELMSLPLMDAVCRETLRLHPPITFVTRVATKDYILPLSVPIEGLDNRNMKSIFVPAGTKLFVSIPQTVYDARVPGVYSHIMTFLGGARACIGFKFSELEIGCIGQVNFQASLLPFWKRYCLGDEWNINTHC
ncbi:Cytochrome P450 4d8 [Termitomyces sp. T112]|nr:Cytochrome P450 4d8 [Termitomyces sp. T112]